MVEIQITESGDLTNSFFTRPTSWNIEKEIRFKVIACSSNSISLQGPSNNIIVAKFYGYLEWPITNVKNIKTSSSNPTKDVKVYRDDTQSHTCDILLLPLSIAPHKQVEMITYGWGLPIVSWIRGCVMSSVR